MLVHGPSTLVVGIMCALGLGSLVPTIFFYSQDHSHQDQESFEEFVREVAESGSLEDVKVLVEQAQERLGDSRTGDIRRRRSGLPISLEAEESNETEGELGPEYSFLLREFGRVVVD